MSFVGCTVDEPEPVRSREATVGLMKIKEAVNLRIKEKHFVLSEVQQSAALWVSPQELKGDLFGPGSYYLAISRADSKWVVEIRCVNTFIKEPRDLVMKGLIVGKTVEWEVPKAVTSTR